MRIVGTGATFLLGLLCALSNAAAASKITYHCTDKGCLLNFSGDIVAGDSKALAQAIRKAPAIVEVMAITSPGGDPFEALKMSAVLNKNFVQLMPGVRNGNGDVVTGLLGRDCASACALMYVTTDQRFGTEVFLHRPTFSPMAFQAIPDGQAEAAYNAKTKQLQKELRDRGVSESLIEEMMSIPSDTVRKLDVSFPERSAWMQEWLTAKCGGKNAADIAGIDLSVKTGDLNAMHGPSGVVFKCEQEAIAAARVKAQHSY